MDEHTISKYLQDKNEQAMIHNLINEIKCELK